MDLLEPEIPKEEVPHYYGDIVRGLFLAGGVILILAVPIFRDLLPINTLVIVIAVLAFGLLAGITNPKQRWVTSINVIVSALGLILFEYYALSGYSQNGGGINLVFLIRQGLALLFFFALYYSVKTLRGMILKQ